MKEVIKAIPIGSISITKEQSKHAKERIEHLKKVNKKNKKK